MTRPFARAAALAGALAVPAALAGCGPDYSPNTYNANAMQQAAKADRGVIIGVRTVKVSASGVIGAATGAAAGGALGSEAPGNGVTSTLGAIGGGLVGGLIGNSVEHAVDDTTVYEYIVEKPNKDSVSVTQKDTTPLPVGLHVLVVAGPQQARIEPDLTVNPAPVASLTPPPSPKPAFPGPDATGAVLPRTADAPMPAVPAAPTGGTEPPPTPVTASPLPAPIPLAPASPATDGIAAGPAPAIPSGANEAAAPRPTPATP